MACMSMTQPGQTLAERMAETRAAIKALEARLVSGAVKVAIGANGGIAFVGWTDRKGISDVCAYRSMMVENSSALRQAIMKAQALSGRKVNPQAIAAGLHSHDNGNSWSKH